MVSFCFSLPSILFCSIFFPFLFILIYFILIFIFINHLSPSLLRKVVRLSFTNVGPLTGTSSIRRGPGKEALIPAVFEIPDCLPRVVYSSSIQPEQLEVPSLATFMIYISTLHSKYPPRR